jgi:hypothetical protein
MCAALEYAASAYFPFLVFDEHSAWPRVVLERDAGLIFRFWPALHLVTCLLLLLA